MQTRHCLYCGHEYELSFEEAEQPPFYDEFLRIFKDAYDSELYNKPLLQYTCLNCGLTLTQADLEKDEERCRRQKRIQGSENSRARSTEEETLDKVKGMLQKCLDGLEFDDYLKQSLDALDRQLEMQYTVCSEALDLLYRHGSPFQNPLEFALCRGLCRTIPLLLCDMSDINGRYQQLEVMLSNILHLQYFLLQDDPEQLLKTLTRLSEILLILGSLPMRCHTIPDRGGFLREDHPYYINAMISVSGGNLDKPGYTDITCRQRAAVLGALALRLEGLKDSPHGTEYLKLALQLWRKVLEQGQEILLSVFMNVGGDAVSQLPANLRKQINAEIQRLNGMIIQRDPHFKPGKLPHQPLFYGMPAFKKVVITAAACALIMGVLSYLTLLVIAVIQHKKESVIISFLLNFGIDGGEVIGFVLYPVLFVYGWLYLEPRLLSIIYKIISPR